jgi:hypothetical protein
VAASGRGEGDLLRPEGTAGGGIRCSWWLEAFFTYQPEALFARQPVTEQKAHGRTAAAVMTRDVIAVDENMPLNEIAGLLERHHIKRVPVLRDGKRQPCQPAAWACQHYS